MIRIEPSPGTLIILVLLIPGLWLLNQLLPVLLVLVAALIIVGTISPAIRSLEKRRMRRGLDIAIVFTALVVLTVLFITLTIPSLMTQVINLLEQEPALHSRLVTWLEGSHLTSPLAELLRNVHP
ncbi:MAG TPA: AI-2E family transporter, partial [Rhodoferax sp.]